MNLFDGVDENELQNKLNETFSSIGDFFKNMEESVNTNQSGEEEDSEMPMPDMKDFFNFNTAIPQNCFESTAPWEPSEQVSELKARLLYSLKSCLSYLLPGGVFQRNTSGGDRWAAPGRAHHQH
jgi:hypothetical protein